MTYDRIAYSSFLWKLGTTSFRTKEFNRNTEWQLRLLDEFWKKPEYAKYGWERKYMFEGQEDIYWIKCRYYDWLVENKFMEGGEPESQKFKTAREKTSGLYDMGLLNENHRLSDVGKKLLELSDKENVLKKNQLGISPDSQLYLEQLLKLSSHDAGSTVRPLIVVLYLLSKLNYLSNEEFTFFMPLCVDNFSTNYILQCIINHRNGIGSVQNTIENFLLSRDNYKRGLNRFCANEFSKELLLSVGMNRKSPKYDMAYIPLYNEMHAVYMEENKTRIFPLFQTLKKFQKAISIKWKQLMFDTSRTAAVKKDPEGHLNALPETVTKSEKDFKKFFFLTMHVNKAMATLEDYKDLNRRYLGLTNIFLFEENLVKMDIVPKYFFKNAIDELYKQAYKESELLDQLCPMSEICPALVFDEQQIVNGLNEELGTNLSTIEDAYDEVKRIKYENFNKFVDIHFTDEKLKKLLDDFEKRKDEEINMMVTDNADIPTIFEYVLGIIWWKISNRKGNILDFLKLSLDSNFLPITHASGGEADIVYEY